MAAMKRVNGTPEKIGSNWLELDKKRPFIPPHELDFLGYPNLSDTLLGWDGEVVAEPPVILPSHNKDLYFDEWPEFWMPLWGKAKSHLDQADRIFEFLCTDIECRKRMKKQQS